MTDESGNGSGASNGTGGYGGAGGTEDEAVMVVACRRGGSKVRKAPAQSWTTPRRTLFLDALAATANVRMAAEAAGMGLRATYKLRQRDAAFAELWEAALEQGYGRLESELLSSALGERRDGAADVNAIEPDGDRATVGPLDQALALQLLALRQVRAGERRRPKPSYKMVPIADVERALMKQLAIAERRLRRGARRVGAGGPAGGVQDGGVQGGGEEAA